MRKPNRIHYHSSRRSFPYERTVSNHPLEALAAFAQAGSSAELDALRVKYLGKKGELTAVLKQMGKFSAEERPAMGQLANEVRAALEAELEAKGKELEAKALEARLEAEALDVTVPASP